MIVVKAFAGKTVAVFGLARSGLASALSLQAGGAQVLVHDDNADRRAEAERLGLTVADLYAADWSRMDAFVVSPGVPLTHPVPHPLVIAAQAAHVPVIGDMELFDYARADLPPAKVIAITGTNGKSTTTALVGHILVAAGYPVAVGGNIGTGVLDLEPLPAGGVYVLELSSFQIDLTDKFRPDVAVLLNMTPDHLDRHGDMAGYEAVKEKLFLGQGSGQVAVIGVDDAHGIQFAERLSRQEKNPQGGPHVIPVSVEYATGGGVTVKDGVLYDGIEGGAVPVGSLTAIETLRGKHNWQNAAAAYAAVRSVGLGAGVIFRALGSFPGLEHRLQKVAARDGIEFINDSKATNIDAASKALGTFEHIYWIAGGKPKTTDLQVLKDFFPHIAKAYLIGDAAPAFAASLGATLDHVIAGDLATATRMAFADARAAGQAAVVLLSPACASYDQFRDFEDRGRQFAALSQSLAAGGA
ncbi:UDP-N-acetylmuramoyl-L-alanine--D-glutamate ligase [Govanella unica]|uniref:UDP-N-acetylmuramoylalanine--D-glutamate ligase n=1 Tax=Govanella unica TaxID=2975056 RepID=A0A9X3Z8H7_9PROT|nr:UDP-N-acetylmuramoyl-L-alanine--D-glutamate ligase [Govania unica]